MKNLKKEEKFFDHKTGFESVHAYDSVGTTSQNYVDDLMMVSQKFTKYVNLHNCSNGRKSISHNWYSSFEKAQKMGMKYDDYMCTAKLEWEE